ncbi:raffinose/stachyose/melibiose transport system permease protein [Kribbella steppae]|uniref:Raffinose/stachyose/melibiose transport system permease protein n=1 Tax=Kribbella steppae TaxID=2512223 RepID=A0A4R2GZS5_9ACTN|nr:raffinose/stachyose/melibiose transport system permease protein [Kribbella steppae]
MIPANRPKDHAVASIVVPPVVHQDSPTADRSSASAATQPVVRRRTARQRRRRSWSALLWVAPAFGMYAVFVLFPMAQSVQYSFYDWDGIGPATPAGLDNWKAIFTRPELLNSVLHAFVLILFYTVLPVGLGLVAAALIRELRPGAFSTTARVVLFIPQVLPLVAAGIAWTWMYSSNGLVNQVLRAVGLDQLTRAWLGDFTFALPAVGVIGVWVMLGFCTVLLLAGIGKIDPALYEAARLDGAGRISEFFAVTLPGLRREIVVCTTFTIIAALASFDVIQIATQGGPGYQTMVPGVQIYRLTFLQQHVGQASALAVFLAVLVLVVIWPIQRLGREK